MKRAPKTPKSVVQKKLTEYHILRWVCRGIVLGTAGFSVWANELHATGSGPSYVFAAVPPIFAIGAWELISRIPTDWGPRWFHRILPALRPIATAGLFVGAAYLSYKHQNHAVFSYTADVEAATIIPLLVDGLMIVTSVSTDQVNKKIDRIEAAIANRATTSTAKPVEEPKSREPNGRERVAFALSRNPDITTAELAKRARVSHNYAYTLSKELRSANGAELVDVDVS